MTEEKPVEPNQCRAGLYSVLLFTVAVLLTCWYFNAVWNETTTDSVVKLLRISVTEDPAENCNISLSSSDFSCLLSKPQYDLNIPRCNLSRTKRNLYQYESRSQEWERIYSFLDRMKTQPDTQFVDVGAKLGTHAVAVSRSIRRQVIAVDFTDLNLRLFRMSVCLGGYLTGHVTLIDVTISEKSKFLPYSQIKLPGGTDEGRDGERVPCTMIDGGISCNTVDNSEELEKSDKSNTINIKELNEIISDIIDREESTNYDSDADEYNSYNMADKLVDLLNIPFVQRQFQSGSKLLQETDKELKKVDLMIKFFFSRNYTEILNGYSL